jgi:hypothetical protein
MSLLTYLFVLRFLFIDDVFILLSIDVCVYFIACAPLAQFWFAWLRFWGVSVSLDGKTGCPSSVCN